MVKIRIMRKEPSEIPGNPRAYLLHPDNPEEVEMRIEKLFPNGTLYKILPKIVGSLKDLQSGVYGIRNKLFEIPGEGTVLYQRYDLREGYAAELELMGFDEQSKVYKSLKNSLDEMASHNSLPI